MDDFEIYFKDIFQEFKQGQTTELTFRSYLKKLIEKVFPELKLSEENKQIRKIGRPDFTCFKKSGVKVGYIETKDIGIDLSEELGGEQVKKYSEGAIPNIILTDYMRFILCRNQESVLDVQLFDMADLKKGKTSINSDKIKKFNQLIETFIGYELPTIKTASDLAIELSKRAKLLRDLAKEQLEDDLQKADIQERSSIADFYEAFKELIKDADIDECIDAYSQTITYGLFLSKISSNNELTRDTASAHIPSSIRIIKKIFSNITGDNLPPNLSWIIDEIIDILNSADINKILSEFVFEGKNYKDPFIHFYEDFLKEYDPEKRKHLGVYYTPEPVVSFITNSINEILKKEFSKPKGFAEDTVKSLDFATGTGTFLANSFVLALKEIRKSGLAGIEKEKIKNHLLKDFYGFEILVSPYVIAHLKLGVLLKEEGYTLENDERVQVYLTNTIDPSETLNSLRGFLKELTHETMMANTIKLEKPILVVMGNPPYAVSSSNKSEWITKLIKDYKEGLKERNIQPLNDDYIKFIRFAQFKIDQNKNGVFGFISNNSYLDGVIHRQMRKCILGTFNRIYILNLHGDSRKQERSPDGSKDENVFDIQQGVCIGLFIKNKDLLGHKVFYADLYGKRDKKYQFLYDKSVGKVEWNEINPVKDHYFFIKRDITKQKKYQKFFKINEIFETSNSGVNTHRDHFLIDFSKSELTKRIHQFLDKRLSLAEIKEKFNLDNTRDWNIETARSTSFNEKEDIRPYNYRPFDVRYIAYNKGFIDRGSDRMEIMRNLFYDNLAIVTNRQTPDFDNILITDKVTDGHFTGGRSYVFPLYIDFGSGSKNQQKDLDGNIIPTKTGVQPNFTSQFLTYISSTYPNKQIPPNDIIAYIYAVLYSHKYRKLYGEQLKTNFPSIPFVKDYRIFNKLAKLGNELIEIHLGKMTFNKNIAKFIVSGSNTIDKILYQDDKIYINDNQYFGNISKEIWNFCIGGYQVLDKWLKSRKGNKLSNQEIEYFIKIVSILNETINLMSEIDKVEI
jgi:predicted helicase